MNIADRPYNAHFERQFAHMTDAVFEAARDELRKRLDDDDAAVQDSAADWLWKEYGRYPHQVRADERDALLDDWLSWLFFTDAPIWLEQVRMSTDCILESWP